MEPITLIRTGKPNKYDHAPQGSFCKVIKILSEEYDVYQQISSHEEDPIWEFVETCNKKTSLGLDN